MTWDSPSAGAAAAAAAVEALALRGNNFGRISARDSGTSIIGSGLYSTGTAAIDGSSERMQDTDGFYFWQKTSGVINNTAYVRGPVTSVIGVHTHANDMYVGKIQTGPDTTTLRHTAGMVVNQEPDANPSASGNDHAFLQYDSSASPNWFFKSGDNVAQEPTDLAIAFAADTTHYYAIYSDDGGATVTCDFFDNTRALLKSVTHSTRPPRPTSGMRPYPNHIEALAGVVREIRLFEHTREIRGQSV